MEQVSLFIKIVFILTTFLSVYMLFRAANYSKPLVFLVVLWLILQSLVSLSGFYTVTTTLPPRFGLLLFPPLIIIVILFLTKKGLAFIDTLDVKTLTLLQIVRILVELGLYYLFMQKVIPGIMTFEGRNFDILCGLTAPFIYYFGYVKKVFGKNVLLGWNIICLLLLANIVVIAVLSAPFPFQKFGFGQPAVAILYFPFTWLPGCIVPIALFAHLVAIRRLVK